MFSHFCSLFQTLFFFKLYSTVYMEYIAKTLRKMNNINNGKKNNPHGHKLSAFAGPYVPMLVTSLVVMCFLCPIMHHSAQEGNCWSMLSAMMSSQARNQK